MISLYGDLKREMEGKPPGKTAVTYVIMNGIEKPHAKRTNKKGEKTVPWDHNYYRMTWYTWYWNKIAWGSPSLFSIPRPIFSTSELDDCELSPSRQKLLAYKTPPTVHCELWQLWVQVRGQVRERLSVHMSTKGSAEKERKRQERWKN